MSNPVSGFRAAAMSALAQGFPLDRVMSGRIPTCDDGKTSLTVDWDGSSKDYTCLEFPWPTPQQVVSAASCGPTPPQALHFCMTDQIQYTDVPPTSGNHRPTWPTYGEYRYVPPQRWLHSLEHGAVVLLYHPCADATEVAKLRAIVTSCLRRHIITPYDKLPKEAPFALLTWGCKLVLSHADEQTAAEFIQGRGIKFAPENFDMGGDFNDQLLKKSVVVSDEKDSNLCPKTSALKLAM